jgi:NTP pyrophosphatase (non-canonical NTP hydrolase)
MSDSPWHLEAQLHRLLAFREERDWGQFHRPKELAAALAIEAAELQELFLWREAESAATVRDDRRRIDKIREEVADIAIFLLLLTHDLQVDLAGAISAKIDANAKRYSVDEHRGVARKADGS